MSAYTLLVFLHVVAAVLMFAAWAVETVVIAQLRTAPATGSWRILLRLRARWGMTGRAAMLGALATGIWMMLLRWMVPGSGPLPWMAGSFVALITIIGVGLVLERRVAPRLRELAADDENAAADALRATSRVLAVSLMLRSALGIGILGLMTAKPGAVASLAILSGSLAAGLISVVATGSRPATIGGMAVESRRRI
jgi:uncharacterized membrane protein